MRFGAVIAAAILTAVGGVVDCRVAEAGDFSSPQLYVRGDVGIANYNPGGFHQEDVEEGGGGFLAEHFGDAPYIGAGIGWQLSTFIRFDVTGEYRSSATVRGLDYLELPLTAPDGTLRASTLYQGEHSAFVGLANLYVDLFQFNGITPYVGAGIGIAHNRLSGFTSQSSGSFEEATGNFRHEASTGTAGDASKNSFAWALMAGASYDLSTASKLDFGYRYLHLGNGIAATTGIIDCTCGSVGAPFEVSGLDAHEFRIGVRWQLEGLLTGSDKGP